MNILLTGATGFMGTALAGALVSRGHTVRPVARREGIDMARLIAPDHWWPMLAGIDGVINAAGILREQGKQTFARLHTEAPVALFEACRRRGVKRVIQISALGAHVDAPTRFLSSKGLADRHLLGSGSCAAVLRPGLIFGPGGHSTALFLRLASLPWTPLPGGGEQWIQPVHIADVVDAVSALLLADPPPRCWDVVGSERMTLASWLARLRRARGLSVAPGLRLPMGLLKWAGRAGHRICPWLHPDNLLMLEQGAWADPAPLQALLGRPARALTTELMSGSLGREGGAP